MAEPVRHRQTKGAGTDMLDLPPPRHISTLPIVLIFGTKEFPLGRLRPPGKISPTPLLLLLLPPVRPIARTVRQGVITRRGFPLLPSGPFPKPLRRSRGTA